MLKSLSGSLLMLDMHTPTPRIVWNGAEVLGVRRVYLRSNLRPLRISVHGHQPDAYASMRLAGITVTELKR